MAINGEDVRNEFKAAQAQGQSAGQMAGGAPGESDQDAAGGSGGTGGYGKAQNQSFHQGQTGGPDENVEHPATRELSRGERFDVEQGGGRSSDEVDFEAELAEDQAAHQDHGQGFIASEGETDTGADAGAVTEGQQP